MQYRGVRMFVSLGVGMLGTVALFGLKNVLMACETCVQPTGALGLTLLTFGAVLVGAGAFRRRRVDADVTDAEDLPSIR